jgi:DNA modification methylase
METVTGNSYTLVNGDSFDYIKSMKPASVDMICTDPPYGMDYQSGMRKEKHAKIANDDNLDWLPEFINQCYRVAKPNTGHYFFCSWHKIDEFKKIIEKVFVLKNILIWDKGQPGMGDLKHDFAPQCEFIIFAQKGQRAINGKRTPNIMRYPRTQNALHPTQKPVPLIAHLITKFSSPGDIIFDPFMGSGTTGVAAKDTQRKFLGIEIGEEWFATSKTRIKANSWGLF